MTDIPSKGRAGPAGGLSGPAAQGHREEQVTSQPQPPRPPGMHRPGGSSAGRRQPRLTRREGERLARLPYVIVLAGVLGGLLWVWLSQAHVKAGMLMFATSFLLAAAARLVLADERAGLLASRRRGIDVAAFAILGAGLFAAALLLKNPS